MSRSTSSRRCARVRRSAATTSRATSTGVGRVRSVDDEGEGRRVWFDAPPGLLRYCVEKGSIAVDGVSLTVAGLDDDGFAVALVPHTLEATTLGKAASGDAVNLEADVLAKYVERLAGLRSDDGDGS